MCNNSMYSVTESTSDTQAWSVLQDLGLNILLYEKQTRLINSKYSVTESISDAHCVQRLLLIFTRSTATPDVY